MPEVLNEMYEKYKDGYAYWEAVEEEKLHNNNDDEPDN